MQYGKVLNLRFYNRAIQFVAKNRILIILTVFFITGFSVAVFTLGKYDFITAWAKDYLNNFMLERSSFTFIKTVADSFLTSMLFVIICLICGTSMLGVILVPAFLAFKGYFYGCLTAYLYSVYSFEGVAFHAVIMLPPTIIFTAVLIFSSIEAMNFSLNLAKLTFSYNSSFDLSFEFRRYSIKLLLYCVLVLISSFADALLTTNFLNNFSGIT